jgi:hypothetical protein
MINNQKNMPGCLGSHLPVPGHVTTDATDKKFCLVKKEKEDTEKKGLLCFPKVTMLTQICIYFSSNSFRRPNVIVMPTVLPIVDIYMSFQKLFLVFILLLRYFCCYCYQISNFLKDLKC